MPVEMHKRQEQERASRPLKAAEQGDRYGNALTTIVNYVDPDRRRKAEEEATTSGVGIPVPFQIGTVRYTSTQHMAELGD